MSNRAVIAIDLDDTLASLTPAIVGYASKMLGRPMRIGNITDKDYWAQYGIDDHEAISIVHGYNLAGFPELQPVAGAFEAVRALAEQYELHVLTSRDPASASITDAWIAVHFPSLFSGVHCLGNQYVSTNARSKAEACRELGVQAIVDDSAAYLTDCIQNGGVPLAVLFGNYPWNVGQELAGMQHAANWAEVRRLLDEQS